MLMFLEPNGTKLSYFVACAEHMSISVSKPSSDPPYSGVVVVTRAHASHLSFCGTFSCYLNFSNGSIAIG